MLLIGFPLGFFVLGIFSGMGACLAELYPGAVRGSGQGFCYSVGRGIGGFCPSLIGVLSNHLSLAMRSAGFTIAAYAVVIVSAWALAGNPGPRVDRRESINAHESVGSSGSIAAAPSRMSSDRAPDGSLHTLKLLSENSAQYDDAAVEGIRRLLKLAPTEMISAAQVGCVKMGTTVATNALLERKGERTLLVITRGFGDALRIATQARPRLFDRHIVLPEMLYERVIEAHERVGAHGETIQSLDTRNLTAQLQDAYAAGLRAAPLCFFTAIATFITSSRRRASLAKSALRRFRYRTA